MSAVTYLRLGSNPLEAVAECGLRDVICLSNAADTWLLRARDSLESKDYSSFLRLSRHFVEIEMLCV